MATAHNEPQSHRVIEPPRNKVALIAGFGIGVVWIGLAVTALWSSARGYLRHRYDWGLGWGLVGLLLLGAGTAALIATWWHLTRVKSDY